MAEVAIKVYNKNEESLAERIRDRALGKYNFNFYPYACYIEYRAKDPKTGVEFRDCVVDYTRCPNQKCIKKLT
ncbi:hypothetical protein [Leptospira sp. GIMC2001]|uniref:hypothetical protein n=1 Tax=Leptospira sp. GIMC2001 TaxID=1513297 RepID=UPI00234AA87C|nr:hypothetical protein [Leptospira sp. GIMC2001]WCL48288.1 hypothetical protein O4O04_13345 [Leptospira sp. GIMC2001]